MTGSTRGHFHTGTLCGIKTVWTEPSSAEGEDITGCMYFRVGITDETLPLRGITHLIEHLSMFHQPLGTPHMNASVSLAHTEFHLQGSPERVCKFLHDVSHAIHHLPADRLELEKQVLSAESADRTSPAAFTMLKERFGLTTYGLAATREVGVPSLTAEQLRWWASRYFTRENCVLVFDGPPPPGLDVQLPSGEFIPAPPATSVHEHFPRHCFENTPQVGFQGHMPNSPLVLQIAEIVQARLKRDATARGETFTDVDEGLSYTGDGRAIVTLTALVKQESSLDGTRDFLGSIKDIACVSSTPRPVTDDELTEYKDALHRVVERRGPSAVEGMSAAAFMMSGYGAVSTTDILEASQTLTPSLVTSHLRQLFDEAITFGPGKPTDASSEFYATPVDVPLPDNCFAYPRIDEPQVQLALGDTGLYLTCMGEHDPPVFWDDVVAVGVFPRPDLLIMTKQGRSVLISTTDYNHSEHLHHALVQKLPMNLAVYQGR